MTPTRPLGKHLSESNVRDSSDGLNNSGQKKTINSVFNSITLCLVESPYWLATAALVFAGPLIEFYGYGLALLAFGAIASMAVTSFFSSWRGTIWKPQDVPAAILAVTAIELVRNASADTSATDLAVTVLALITVSTWVTGIFLYLLGKFRLGNMVRYLPFPVIAGFLGGTGWLLLKAGVDISIGDAAGSYWQPDSFLRWCPTVSLAIAAWWLSRRYNHPLILPGLMLLCAVAFHLLLLLPAWPLDSASSVDWMFSALSSDLESTQLQLADFSRIDWAAIVQHSGAIVVLAFASLIAMLLNNSGFELQVGRDFDINKDLRVAGVANMAGGLFGGWPGYLSPASSLISARQGQQLPAVGFLVAVGVTMIIWFAIPQLSLVPLFVIGSGVAYLGVLFIVDWVISSYKRLGKGEYLIVLCIVATIALFGLASGVIIGLLLTVALFLITVSRVDVIRHQMSGENRRSRVKYKTVEQAFLQEKGPQILLFELQGYIFFGTANQLLERIRTAVSEDERRFIVLDFERVSGVDSTAVSSFLKLQKDAIKNNIKLVLSGLDNISSTMIEQQFISANFGKPIQFDDIDGALESIERQQLLEAKFPDSVKHQSVVEFLQQVAPEASNLESMLGLLDRLEMKRGDYLIQQGELATEMFFIESGSITAQLEHGDGRCVRLETMGQGVVGELAFYLGNKRTAAVVCNEDVIVYRLTRDKLAEIQNLHPKQASNIHLILAKLLSERTTHLIKQVAALQI